MTAALRAHLKEVEATGGRAARLFTLDMICAENKSRQLIRLAQQNRVVNPSRPGEPGTDAEHAAVLREMASDISEFAHAEAGPTLCVVDRWLCEFDQSLTPPAIRLTTPAAYREVLTRLMNLICDGDPWGYYYRLLDRNCWGHEEYGAVFIPDLKPISTLDLFTDRYFRMVHEARRWPYVATLAEILDSLGANTTAETEEEGVTRQLREVLAGGLQDVLAADLAEMIGWSGPIQGLTAMIHQMAAAGEIGFSSRRQPKTGKAVWHLTLLTHLTPKSLTSGDEGGGEG